ncbi:FtsK/SpoIIIE domain-containing protein [Phytohabitans rumicis]|uniref:Cell division protein FtsK n=1 Tax=Phytohabitans rumicis TaxID=1076125 RepID=A0A6V8LI61_9ACTN|nr:FtsK/SpoIIIE domain-containing protein [Phytohabitans rumicis]GFJ94548.1 cell division protein FtsK [Phytohabitans rumicis]
MPDVRTSVVESVRAALSRARAAARVHLDAARSDLAGAEARLARVQQAGEQRPARAAAERDRRLAELADKHAAGMADLARRAAVAGALRATGAAGDPWPGWHPTPAIRTEPPDLLRVGEIRIPGAPPVPALVPLLDRGHVALVGPHTGPGAGAVWTEERSDEGRQRLQGAGASASGASASQHSLVATLLLRALGRAAPGTVRITGYDPERLGGGLAGFAPLAPAGLLTFVGPGGLAGLLDDLVDHIRRINETVLAGEHSSLREMAVATGKRPEPWRVAVLLGGDELSRHERAQLERILRTGAACGVHLIVRGIPVPEWSTVETVTVDGDTALLSSCGPLPVLLDGPPPADLVTATSRRLAERVSTGPAPAVFADLLPEEIWTESSAAGLTAPVGDSPEGRPVSVTLADYPPHALIAGPSGTGKTNLIYAWMGALSARYSPTELEFYLLDFKEGVSFARFAPGQRDPSWLPHVRLVGVNVNTDREFGLALLRFLGRELRRRADAAKQHEVTKLAELRAEDPTGHWPRIVAVVDEFQVLLTGRDALAQEAATLLEDLARRGRSQGIHLILASQDVSGIEALWGRPALVAQFTLRIALPKARRILAETNTAAETLPRHHAVVNADSGAVEANRIVRIPAASDRRTWGELQHRLWRDWRDRPASLGAPRLFDGDAVPQLATSPDFAALRPGTVDPVVLLGESIDVQARSARLPLSRSPGRNIAVVGTRVEEACAVLAAAARSLARQSPDARFSVACLDQDAAATAESLRPDLPPDTGWYDAPGLAELLPELEPDPSRPHYLFLFAADAAASTLAVKTGGRSGHEHLRRLLNTGPERRTHVLGWWRSVARLRDDLGGIGSRTDSIGAWVALDVQGGDLSGFYPQQGGPVWYPRPWRALYFDRARHRTPEVVIPYGLTT